MLAEEFALRLLVKVFAGEKRVVVCLGRHVEHFYQESINLYLIQANFNKTRHQEKASKQFPEDFSGVSDCDTKLLTNKLLIFLSFVSHFTCIFQYGKRAPSSKDWTVSHCQFHAAALHLTLTYH